MSFYTLLSLPPRHLESSSPASASDQRGGAGFCSCNEASASVARSLTKSNFAPAMMHDARRITDVVDRVRQRTAISCLARFSRVDEAAFSFSQPLCILGWKPPPRSSVGFLFISPFVRWTRTSSLRPQTESEGRSDGRKERSNYTEQSARINSHHSRTLISICGRPRGCQSIMDWGYISTQDLSSFFLRIH